MLSLRPQKVRLLGVGAGRNVSTQGFHSLRHGFVTAFVRLCHLSCLSKRRSVRSAQSEKTGWNHPTQMFWPWTIASFDVLHRPQALTSDFEN